MLKNASKWQVYTAYFTVMLTLLQSYNWWGEKQALSLYFLIGGIVLLLMTIVSTIYYIKKLNISKKNVKMYT
ncbi:hypothetical protein SAMN04487786_2597 [Paenisporosarcina quisquiliarum]|nr:hypothetical protein SAMN04487786_2597 [Paenisporosarcina quisquiliarum]